MDLITHMNRLVADIHWGLPCLTKASFFLVCLEGQVSAAIDSVTRLNGSAKIHSICVCDAMWKSLSGDLLANAQRKYAHLGIPIVRGKAILSLPQTLKAAFVSNMSTLSLAEMKHAHVRIRRFMLRYGFLSYSIFSQPGQSISRHRKPYPTLYKKYKEQLEKVYLLLETHEDKDIYARYVQTTLSGNFGYLRENSAPQYYHHKATILPGDVILDAGVSADVSVVKSFGKQVGSSGLVYAFEPSIGDFKKAEAALKAEKIDNVALLQEGLWSAPQEMTIAFDAKGPSCGRLVDEAAIPLLMQSPLTRLETCRLTSVDAFVAKQAIRKVDVIKMDIEGAEKEALLGAKETIMKFSPKLLIAIYHKPTDIFEILLLIHELQPQYKFYLKQQSWLCKELILIASIEAT